MDPTINSLTIPPTLPHTHTVVFLHGRGDSPANFAFSLTLSPDARGLSLAQAFPSLRWVFPAPEPAKPGERTCQWFDIWNVADFADREHLQAPGLRASVARVRRILEAEAALAGRWDRIVLAGISQGSAVGTHVLLNLDAPRLAAFLSFSARMPFPGRSLADTRAVLAGLDRVPAHDDVLRNTPVLLEHCVDDPLVLVRHGRTLRDTLVRFGADVTWSEYPDGGHWFNSPAGMEEAAVFLERVLGIRRVTDAGVKSEAGSAVRGSSDAMDLD